MATCDKIVVAIRVRPITSTGGHDVVTHDAASSSLIIGADRSFTFDHIFSADSDQKSVFETLVNPLITDCLNGINATVVAYGQTGSGKTFTMGTSYDFDDFAPPEGAGIIPRALVSLFDKINCLEDSTVTVEAQFIELYNEELRDLLTPKKNIVKIQEKSGGGIYLSGAKTVLINTVEEALTLIRSGGDSRSTASTKMNTQSSRSHAILTLLVNQKNRDSVDSRVELMSSKFHFVDLAGSERLGRTGAEGDRAKEGIKINYGLLALGNVINALSENQKHVPYRDSKLTRLLCDSLGGNSRTVLIACISPADIDFAESVNTLQYATRAKRIRNTISVNIDNMSTADAATLKKLLAENRRLRQQLKSVSVQYQSSRCKSAPYGRSPARGLTSKAPLPGRARQALVEIVKAFDKTMHERVKQMSAITCVAVARYRKSLELTNLKLQHEVLRGCSDCRAFPLLAKLRALEKEVEDADTEASKLASDLRRSAATIRDLHEKVERTVQSFPPSWRHVPQTAQSMMAVRLANYDSSGLQCYNNNLLHILQLSQTEHERELSVIDQLTQIAGSTLLRHYLPSLMNMVTAGGSFSADAFDNGARFKQDGSSISSLLTSMFDSKTRVAAFSSGQSTGGARTHAKPRTALDQRTAMNRLSFVSGRGCDLGTNGFIPMVGTLPPQPPNSYRSPPSSSGASSDVQIIQGGKTITRAVGVCLPRAIADTSVLPPMMPILSNISPRRPVHKIAQQKTKSLVTSTDAETAISIDRSAWPDLAESTGHHNLETTSLTTLTDIPGSDSARFHVQRSSRVVWHKGLPLPVVDSPDQENRPPVHCVSSAVSNVPPTILPPLSICQPITPPVTTQSMDTDRFPMGITPPRVALRSRPSQSCPPPELGQLSGTKRSLDFESLDEEQHSGAGHTPSVVTVSGSEVLTTMVKCDAIGDTEQASELQESQHKKKRFVVRKSILERFARCGIDFTSLAPPTSP